MGLFKRKRKVSDEFLESLAEADRAEADIVTAPDSTNTDGGMAALFSDYMGDDSLENIAEAAARGADGDDDKPKEDASSDGFAVKKAEKDELYFESEEFLAEYERTHSDAPAGEKKASPADKAPITDEDYELLRSYLDDNRGNEVEALRRLIDENTASAEDGTPTHMDESTCDTAEAASTGAFEAFADDGLLGDEFSKDESADIGLEDGFVELADEDDSEVSEATSGDTEPTTDEIIEEFIKNGGFASLEAESADETLTETLTEPLTEPEFVLEDAEGDTDEAPVTDESELSPPEALADMDFDPTDSAGVGTTDMNLRIAFGLEEDTEDDEVAGAVKKLADRFEADRRVGRKLAPEHSEYTDPIQARDIAGEYKKRRRSVTLRLVFAIIFASLLLVFENITVITELLTGSAKQFAGALDPEKYPVVYIMVSLQLLFITAAFALPELRHGAKRLFSAAPTPESSSLLLVLAGTAISAISAYFAKDTSEIVTFNAVSAVSVVMTLVYSRLNIKREMMTFYVVGSKKKKYAMKNVPDEDSLLSSVDCDDDMYGDVMRVEQSGFIDGFFSRMSTPDRMTGAFVAGIMAFSVAAAVIFGFFASKSSSDIPTLLKGAYLALLAMTPFALQLTFSYPFYRAASAAASCDSAIVGECSLDEYASAAVVSFDDGNLFPSYGVKVQNIRIYNNARIDRVLYYASSVFKSAGGPLSDVFEVATMEMGRSDSVELLDADAGFLEARVDGVRIIFGSHTALAERGYEIDDSVARDDVDFSDELSIMYMFREDVLISKMYIKYVLDGDTEAMLRQFHDYGMYLCVRTYDPNIDEDMICSKLSMREPPIKVVRYRSADDARGVCERTDSGFVTYSSPKMLLQLLPYCDKVIHTKRTCAALTVMSMIISVMLIAVLTMSSGLGFVRGIHMIAWHVVWMLPAYIASKIFIR